jgi:hypothetical protein
MPMNPRLLRPTQGGFVSPDADARAYLAAVRQADGANLEPRVAKAISDFIIGLKADSLWSAIKASCILAGARTLSGALTPLVGSAPTNNGPFVSGDYNRKGLVGNGTSKYLNTNFAFLNAAQNNRHGAVWVTTPQSSGSHAYFGAGRAAAIGTVRTQLVAANGAETNLISRCADETSSTSATANNVAGLQGLSRSASGSYTRRAATTDQTVTQASLANDEGNVWVFARNTTSVTGELFSSGRIAFYSFGDALTLSTLDTRVSALITAIGAAIP